MRAPGELGKPTTMPACRPLPSNTSVPWRETWRGLLAHCELGVQDTRVICTAVSCKETCTVPPLGAVRELGALPPALAVEGGGPEAPPAPFARAVAGAAPAHSIGAISAPARKILRSCT